MTIATRGLLSPSWATPRIDLGGCVLYLPLWRPSGDMNGSTIYSYGSNRHSCTVTGATYGKFGRTFDGTDDNIALSSTALNFTTSPFTIEAWVKITDVTKNRMIYCRGAGNDDGYYARVSTGRQLTLVTNQSGANQQTLSSVNSVPLGEFCHLVITRSGEDALTYVNGANATSTAGTHVNPDTSTKIARVGSYNDPADVNQKPLLGIYGEVRVYNRALTQSEILRNDQVTKWRYKT